VRWWAPVLAAAGATGCWKTEFAELPTESVAYSPSSLDVPTGWVVSSFEVPLTCPDGEFSRYYVLYPEGDTQPLPVAVVYPSGTFDYVYAADPQDPLGGAHYATPSRLTRDWSVLQIFTTLGMYPVTIEGETQEGTLIAQLVDNGVAVMLPGNCWGDMYHNAQGAAENRFTAPNGDYFFRQGRISAEWAFRFLVDPAFAGSQLVQLPITVDVQRVYAIGLGEGGRAVGELLSLDIDGDAVPDYHPAGVIVDSMVEDLAPWYADPARYATIVSGLNRIFPGELAEADLTSLSAVPTLPERLLYTFDPAEPSIPNGAHSRMLARLEADGGATWPISAGRYPVTNAGDPAVAAAAVAYLLGGTPPPVTLTGPLDTGN
jgi:hypothetical protein